MTETTITIAADLEDALESYRVRRGLPSSLSVVVEDVVREYLTSHGYLLVPPFRPLRITPAETGSGLTDVSVNHDRYLTEDVVESKTGRSR